MAREFRLPDLGEGIHEAEIIEILVSVGDQVQEEDTILVAETDKAAVEIPSPFTAKVTAVNVEVGQIVTTGDVVVEFDGEGAEPTQEAAPESELDKPAQPQPAPAPAAGKQPDEKAKPADRQDGRPVPASPATRRLARELEVDLAQVPATGDAGRVTSADVRQFAEGGQQTQKPDQRGEPGKAAPAGEIPDVIPAGVVPQLPDFAQWGEIEREPLRSVRRATARQMALSWSQIPHVVHQDEVDITELEEFRKKHQGNIAAQGGKLSPTVFALKAAVIALKEHPRFNASLNPAAEEIILKQYYHIGVAVDTDRGLLVPVIKDVDKKSLSQLSVELYEMADRAREGKTTLDELQGGTFSITNIGVLGGTSFAPIINFPEVAILGMARARWKPVVTRNKKGELVTNNRYILPLMLAFDHRVVDGADAARFMNVIKKSLQTPDDMLLMM